eukprot:gnl/TRDRNA2_/TRDRNA2_172453_c2_seq6.p1 gnl/TRDRNA2_/TRDRNA2_172453_c2~~gnl/TRDRNA2_/TRDRNA2_172453_c2_seq6.p1  ORF type:complete len:174 (-),score=19.24 gnl/TRDRNA2_/TRDRNA2_172453_c2_seq6:207-728(-)
MSKARSDVFTLAKAHSTFARSWALNSLSRDSAALVKKSGKSFSCGCFTFANAHAVLVSSCTMRSRTLRYTACANVPNSCSDCFTVALAHAVLARSWLLKSPVRCSAIFASAMNSFLSDCFAVAKAQAVMAQACELNLPIRCAAALADVASSFSSMYFTAATAHAMLAMPYSLN